MINRSNIVKSSAGLKITIPSHKNKFYIISLITTIVPWFLGLLLVIISLSVNEIQIGKYIGKNVLQKKDIPSLIYWFFVWGSGGLFFLHVLYWQLWGKEIIIVTRKSIEIKKRTLFRIKKKEYVINKIKNLGISSSISSLMGINYFKIFTGLFEGIISFNYEDKIIHFFIGDEEEEANKIIKEIRNFIKS